jgi:hypothetical protein
MRHVCTVVDIHAGSLRRRCASALIACAFATAVSAQTTPAADATPASTRRAPAQPPQTLALAVSLVGGSSQTALESGVDPQAVGPHADADASLTYQRRAGRATFGVTGQSVVRHSHDELTPMRQQGGVAFSAGGQRQQFHASQSVSYTPYYQFGGMTQLALMPLSEAALSHGDLANADLSTIAATTDVDWSRTLSQRVGVSALYSRRSTTFGQSDLDMITQSAGAKLTRRVTRFASLRTGYTYRFADFAFNQTRLREHDLDLGLDYSRPVSASGRTTVSFGSGSSLTPQEDGLAFRLTGDAAVTRLIGRTWNARVGVNRSVHLLEGFAEPVLANIVNLGLGGTLQRRVSVSSWASLSTGTVGLTAAAGNGYENWSAGGGLSVMVGRRGTFDAQYFIAGDRFEGGVVLPPGLSNERRQRQGLRAGFSWRGLLVGR